ncbi:MAG: HD domain-containing protein [bacterium]
MTNKERALMVAEKAHANQTYDIYPYIYHVRQVMQIAESLGYDENIIVSCILHDVLEDTDLSYNDIKKAFGKEVAEIVYAVTDELGRNRTERKLKTLPKIRSNWKATVVKICDRIANMTQSKMYNKNLFDMYIKEYDEFYNQLNCQEHPQNELTKVWNKLNELIK